MSTHKRVVLLAVFFLSSCLLFAQENQQKITLKKDFDIQKYTIMEQFEPGYVVSPEERADMKQKRIEDAEFALRVLDTAQISNRKRKLLLRDLKYNPFSDRLNKFIVDSKFEDEEFNPEQK